MAVTVALPSSDVRTADVAESVLAYAPVDGPEHLFHYLRHLAATGRAIARTRRTPFGSPAERTTLTVAPPEELAGEGLRTWTEPPHFARALLTVTQARHSEASARLDGEMGSIAKNAPSARVAFVR